MHVEYNHQMDLQVRNRFVIWGFNRVRHSHRFIHKGYFETLKSLGKDVIWLDDHPDNKDFIKAGDVVITVGIQSSFLPINPNVHYVLHNVSPEISDQINNQIKLKVFTNDSSGSKIDESIALWDEKNRMLYQPWGLPELPDTWLSPNLKPSNLENWIGLVWDDELNQGNIRQIGTYKSVLKENGIKFKKLGGTQTISRSGFSSRTISREGLSSKKSFAKVNQSAIGAAIVGEWQQQNGYIPCRAFKNVAAGAIPISNSNFTHVFGDSYLYSPSIADLVDVATSLKGREILERSEDCKQSLQKYSYESALKRIIDVLL